jgi:Flp pilus assembly pilin Flp
VSAGWNNDREVGMYERMSLMFGRLITISLDDLKREDGQGATEYAMVVAFVIVGLTVTLGLLGTSIQNFLGEVAGKIDALIP